MEGEMSTVGDKFHVCQSYWYLYLPVHTSSIRPMQCNLCVLFTGACPGIPVLPFYTVLHYIQP